MTFLTPHLPFPGVAVAGPSTTRAHPTKDTEGALPPPGTHLIITDTLNSPGQFALHHLVSAAGIAKRQVIWVDFRGEGRASWESVQRKLGTPLPPSSSSSFIHLTPTSLAALSSKTSPLLVDAHGDASLLPTYTALTPFLPSSSGTSPSSASASERTDGPLVLLDGLSELTWLGLPAEHVERFVRAVIALRRKSGAVVVSTLHADHLALTQTIPPPPLFSRSDPNADLLGRLIRLGGGGWWRISNLISGRSGDVHGEISSHSLFPLPLPALNPHDPPRECAFPDVPRSHPLQYRLENNTVKVFPKGTGRGFL